MAFGALTTMVTLPPVPTIVRAGTTAGGTGTGETTLDSTRRLAATAVVFSTPARMLGCVTETRVGPLTRSVLPTAIAIELKQYSPGARSITPTPTLARVPSARS